LHTLAELCIFALLMLWVPIVSLFPLSYFSFVFVGYSRIKWSLDSDCPVIDAYNTNLYRYITKDNKCLSVNTTQKRIIAANYHILSAIKDKIENYLPKHQENDELFLQKVANLHHNSQFDDKIDKTVFLWTAKWRDLTNGTDYCQVLVMVLFSVMYLSAIFLITHILMYSPTWITFVVLEFICAIAFIWCWNVALFFIRLLPDKDVSKMYHALHENGHSPDKMIKNIEKVYKIMFVTPLEVKTLYSMDNIQSDISSIIAEYLWQPLPLEFAREHHHVSINMNANTN